MFGVMYGKLPMHLLPKLYRWIVELILEIFHPVLLAKMSQLSQISDKQLGIDLPCRKQCKYNSPLKFDHHSPGTRAECI